MLKLGKKINKKESIEMHDDNIQSRVKDKNENWATNWEQEL